MDANNSSKVWADSAARSPGGTSPWLFILGVNNSGTGLLERVISKHPGVRSLPDEGQLLSTALPRPWRHGVSRLWTQRLDLFRLTEEHSGEPAQLAKAHWLPQFSVGEGYLMEKSPPRAIQSRWLNRWFSPAFFVGIVRNPFAACEGIRRRCGCGLEPAAIHWSIGNQLMIRDLEHVEHSLLVRYEDLVRDPLSQLRTIASFLELSEDFDSRVLDERIEAPNRAGAPLPLQDLNSESLEQMSTEDLRIVDFWTQDMRQRLGYPDAQVLCGPRGHAS